MTRNKRARPESDDESDPKSLQTSSAVHKGLKRQRANTDLQEVDDDELQDKSPMSEETAGGNVMEEEAEEDYDEEEEESDIETSTQRATEAIVKKNSQFTTNAPADYGIVTTIEVENFMCHDHLEVKLGPLINFIIGHNGSGKSAILTALTLCLGGKATSTNRGSSLKAFIKEGRQSSRITVKLKNSGDGYKPDVYGDVIIVERTFSREGGSGYKLKSKTGKVISTKREELDEICDYMGLQVDNPMNVLTQDAARQFINNSSEREKYKFYVKGVQLEQLDQDYRLLMDSITNTEATLESKKVYLMELKKIYESWKQRLEQCKGQKEIRHKLKHYRDQIAWVQVEEKEKELKVIEQEIEEIEDVMRTVQDKINASEAVYNDALAMVEKVTANLASEREKARPLEDDHAQLKEKFDTNKKELIEIQHDQRSAKSQMQGTLTRISKFENDIENEKRRLAAINGGSNSRLVAFKEEIVQEQEKNAAQIQALESEYNRLQEQLTDARNSARDLPRQIEGKQREIQSVNTKAKELRTAQSRYMSVFGPQMPALLEAIEVEARNGRWIDRPVGPIGQHIKLKRSDWSTILESILGQQLKGFIVTNHADKQLLLKLMDQTKCDCPVTLCKPAPIRLQTPDSRYTTILDILEISHPLVEKQLVIQANIEQSLLFDDQEEANAAWAIVTEDNRHHINIKVCYAKNQGRQGWGLRIGGGRVGGNFVKPVPAFQGAPRMRTDLDSQLRQAEHEISQLSTELNFLMSTKGEKDQIVADLDNSLRTFEIKKRNLRVEKQRLEDRLEKVNMELEQNVVDNRLQALESTLQDLRDGLNLEHNGYAELSDRRTALNGTQNELKMQIMESERELSSVRAMVSQREKELSEAMQNRQQALSDKNHWYHKLEKQQAALREKQMEHSTLQATIKEYIEKARTICERVQLDKGATYQKLEATYGRLRDELKASEKRIGGSEEEIATKTGEAASNYRRSRQDLAQMAELLDIMNRSYKDRTYRWGKFRHYISARARAQFMWLMSQRAYRGRLRIDHEAQELKPEVQTNQHETGTGRGPKTLSGGEKSFSTVCLLLALWEAMGSPIRCLDEFDVFMDPVNRTVSVNLMIGAARRSIGKQFILITPQDMSSIDKSADVKVTRLRDPERNQRQIDRMLRQ